MSHAPIRTRLLVTAVASGLAAVALAGCTLLVEDEVKDLRINLNAKRHVHVSLRDFGAHEGQIVDVQIVDPDAEAEDEGRTPNPQLRARAGFDAFPGSCIDLHFFRGAAVAATRVDFFADLNESGAYEPPPDDHAWRFELDEAGRLDYVHELDFTDLAVTPAGPIGTDLVVSITGAEEHDGEVVVATLVKEDVLDVASATVADSVNGIFVTRVESGTLGFRLTGIVDAGTRYHLELRFDDSGSLCVTPEELASPATGDFDVSLALSEMTCTDPAPPDCAGLDADCRAESRSEACGELARQCPFVDCTPR